MSLGQIEFDKATAEIADLTDEERQALAEMLYRRYRMNSKKQAAFMYESLYKVIVKFEKDE